MAKKAKGKTSTIFYHDWLELFAKMSHEEVGKLTVALLSYDSTGELPEFNDRTLDLVFTDLSRIVRHNREDYEQTCKNRAEYQRKKKEEEDTKVYKSIQEYTKVPDSESDKDTDNDNESESGTDKDNDNDITPSELRFHPPEIGKQIQQIMDAWNRNKLIRSKINHIPPLSRRYNDTFLTIGTFGFETFMEQIRKLDDNKFFEDWHPHYDWFCDPNNFNKVLDGNYLKGKKKPIDVNSKEYWDSL